MATTQYDEALRQAHPLSPADQERLLTDVAKPLQSMHAAIGILELQGPGKEIWAGTDAEKHLDQEGSSWNG